MTITSHEFIRGKATENAELGGREGNVTVRCYSDDPQDTGHAVLEYLIAQGFTYGTKYNVGNDLNPRNRLVSIDTPSYIEGSCMIWETMLRYRYLKPLSGGGGSDGEIDSPLDLRPQVKTSPITRSVPFEKAVYRGGLGTPWTVGQERAVTNSAGIPYVPTIEFDEHNRVVTVSRLQAAVNTDSYPMLWVNEGSVTINNGLTSVGLFARECKSLGFSTEETDYEGTDLVQVTWRGEIRVGGWYKELLDRGVSIEGCSKPDGRGGYHNVADFPDGTPGKRNLMDIAGVPVSEPHNLDGAGNPVAPCTDEAHYSSWSGYTELDPRTLGFFAGIMT